jgi:tight adherence protein C
MPLHLYILIALTVACGGVALWSALVSPRQAVRARLEAIRGGGAPPASPSGLSVFADQGPRSTPERLLASLGQKQATQGGATAKNLGAQLRHAGFRRPSAPAIALGIRAVLLVGLPLMVSPFLVRMIGSAPTDIALACGAPAVLGYILPSFVIGTLASHRQTRINAALPDVLDLLVLCMEAGLGLNAAITRVAEERAGSSDPLGQELGQLANELRVGVPRRDALTGLAERVGIGDLRTVVAQLIHTERLGGNVGPALRAQSEAIRSSRKLRCEEVANKMPVRMLLPTLVFVMPLFIVLFTPVLMRATAILSGE